MTFKRGQNFDQPGKNIHTDKTAKINPPYPQFEINKTAQYVINFTCLLLLQKLVVTHFIYYMNFLALLISTSTR